MPYFRTVWEQFDPAVGGIKKSRPWLLDDPPSVHCLSRYRICKVLITKTQQILNRDYLPFGHNSFTGWILVCEAKGRLINIIIYCIV